MTPPDLVLGTAVEVCPRAARAVLTALARVTQQVVGLAPQPARTRSTPCGMVEVIRTRVSLADNPQRMLLAGVRTALRDLAQRWKALDAEIKALDKQIQALVTAAAPEPVDLQGVGVEIAGQILVTVGDNTDRIRSEAAFAKICGVAPQPVSGGRTAGRHRLSRGGDRAANSALHIVAIVRMRHHQPTATTSDAAPRKA
jgi:transposase